MCRSAFFVFCELCYYHKKDIQKIIIKRQEVELSGKTSKTFIQKKNNNLATKLIAESRQLI